MKPIHIVEGVIYIKLVDQSLEMQEDMMLRISMYTINNF